MITTAFNGITRLVMTIYLVRWPDLSAALVRAENEEHLLHILDQVGNSEGCEWSLYEGPLFIEFRLPVEWSLRDTTPEQPVTPEQVVVGDVSALAGESIVGAMEVALAGDDGYDAGEQILRTAFPKLHAVIEKHFENGDEERSPPEAELRVALHEELSRLLRASWRRAQLRRKDDTISHLAREMDLPVRLARQYAEIALERQASKAKDADPSEED